MNATAFHRVPPDPQVMAQLHAEYLRYRGKKKLSFAKYLKRIGFTDPAAGLKGADRGSRPTPRPGMERVLVPARAVMGTLRLLVLLADFPDNKGLRPASEFEDMLFSNGTFQTGSMRDFYSEVSCGKVDVAGSVHGWLRMPHKYSYYVGSDSGMGAYPHNAQKLAADVLAAAKKKKVPFAADLDKFGDGSVTALFVVHAGQGAEARSTVAAQKKAIWSHKADDRHDLENPNDSDEGDPGDPFPGLSARHDLGDTGSVSTSFPGQQPSGVSLRSITLDANGNVRFDVIFA